MKLYREVNVGVLKSMTINGNVYIPYEWLKSIEITEEEMRDKHPIDKRPGQVYENAYNDGWNDAISDILSKLKNG